MLNRRDFLLSTLLASATAALGTRATAAAPDTPDLWLNRLTFGATAEARDRFRSLGAAAWLDDQLSRPARDDGLTARLAAARLHIAYEAGDDGAAGSWAAVDEDRPLTLLDADPASLLPLIDWSVAMDYNERLRPAEEVIAASLIRAVHAPAQLREVMTQFWHDHFNVHSEKDEYVANFFPAYDAGLRDRAFGNFRDLLGFVATSPAMLVYLTNDESRASPANENFARELLELHTLGAGVYMNDRVAHWSEVPGAAEGLAQGYIDEDVYEVARCFTGWTIGDGRWVAEGATTPKTGLFAYVEGWHDPYQKRVLGRDFPSHRAPLADGEEVLDILATHPATARFVCTKIARRLLADDPAPDLVDRLAAVFLGAADAPDQMAQVIRALATDPAFAAPPERLRRPFEFLAAILRATGAEVASREQGWVWNLARAGWRQHAFPPPTGHPDRNGDWETGLVLLRLTELALYAQDDWFGLVSAGYAPRLPPAARDVAAIARHWGKALTGAAPDLSSLAAAEIDPGWQPEGDDERHAVSALTVAMAALTPQFLYR